jgi:hypothetical protein
MIALVGEVVRRAGERVDRRDVAASRPAAGSGDRKVLVV